MTKALVPVKDPKPTRKDTGGRPAYSDAVRRKLLKGLRSGMTRRAASGFAGVHHDTLYEWMKDEAFRIEVEEAENYAEASYTATVHDLKADHDAPHSVRLNASKFWLERRRPKEWREQTSVELNMPPETEEARSRSIDDLRDELRTLGEELLRRGSDRTRKGHR